MNTGGMSPEEHTRLNIFLLSESIARTMKNSQDAPRHMEESNNEPISTPEPAKVEEVIEQPLIEQIDGQISMEDIDLLPDPVPDPVHNLVKDTPYQNEFGEIL